MTEIYDTIGSGYASQRRPDPRIADALRASLEDCRSVVNVGAGTGSYEPRDLEVIAVEPSSAMIRQRPQGSAPVIQARAEVLPFRDSSFDAALGVLTLHHWKDIHRGLSECARIARRRVVFLTLDTEASKTFWLLQDYFPDIHKIDQDIFPRLEVLEAVLGSVKSKPLNIPADCTDGFLGAYWRRPEAYLDPHIRAGMSTFSKIADVDERIEILRRDLQTGQWARRHGHLMRKNRIDLGYRVVTAELS